MPGFIWFGRQVDVKMLKQSIYRDPRHPLTLQILSGNRNIRTDAAIPYSWHYSYHPSPHRTSRIQTLDYSRNRRLGRRPLPYTQLAQSHKKVNSLYGSASFNYKDWLNVDLTGRNDWSSTLPAGANSLFYPSIGAAFVFTDALGLQTSWLSYGKIRASWTRVGNDTDPYQLAAVYGAGTAWGGLPSFTAPDRLPKAELKPERTTGQEI